MKPSLLKSRPRRGGRSGHAMVEFAIGSTILVTVFAGVFQYGFIFYQYNALENAVINGAHYASQRSYDSLTATPSTSFQTAVKNMVVYGDPTGTNTTPIVKNLAASNVNISVGMLGSGTDLVPISMTVYITGYTIDAIFGSFTCTNKPAVTYAYQGIFAPHP